MSTPESVTWQHFDEKRQRTYRWLIKRARLLEFSESTERLARKKTNAVAHTFGERAAFLRRSYGTEQANYHLAATWSRDEQERTRSFSAVVAANVFVPYELESIWSDLQEAAAVKPYRKYADAVAEVYYNSAYLDTRSLLENAALRGSLMEKYGTEQPAITTDPLVRQFTVGGVDLQHVADYQALKIMNII